MNAVKTTWTKPAAMKAARLLQDATGEKHCVLYKNKKYFACEVFMAKMIIMIGGASLVAYC